MVVGALLTIVLYRAGLAAGFGGLGRDAEPGPLHLRRLIHERPRLGIVRALAVNDSLTFSDLKKLFKTTEGNLSVHARKLEEARYITCAQYFQGRLPKTEYRLTAAGRRALEKCFAHMEALIQAMRDRWPFGILFCQRQSGHRAGARAVRRHRSSRGPYPLGTRLAPAPCGGLLRAGRHSARRSQPGCKHRFP